MLTWAVPFNICCFLDSQDHGAYPGYPSTFECLLGAGAAETCTASAGSAFPALKEWAGDRKDWLFGHWAYELAAETEPSPRTPSLKPEDPIGFPDLLFFVPEVVMELQHDHIRIGALNSDPATIWRQLQGSMPAAPGDLPAAAACQYRGAPEPVSFTPRFTREEYLATVKTLQRHILRGDCYEINFCQEFFAGPVLLDPFSIWQALSSASPNPFSAFYRLDERFLICASPERFLKKTGPLLISQPIKGTAPRNQRDPLADEVLAADLHRSPKDRAENIMVVDLVRNDLSRVSKPGSVKVAELCGVYPFPQVFQLISTVTGEMLPDIHWSEAIRATFPMGSMTGAPKNRVVELIAQYERSRRGLFSGAVGYVTPAGDFDFNVVIRSLFYRRDTRYLSYQVGSGITWYSDPAAEYAECLIKAEGIRKALQTI
jgi:para-aminobenzoate synthetase component I